MSKRYDAIILGARCAGSPTAMLLARKGYRVLVVDRSTFPSDTVSTHVLQPMAVAALARWGLLERLTATGCPPVSTFMFDFGPVTITGAPGTEAAPHAYCPRRTVLDKMLVDAAAEAGAEIREGFSVERLLMEGERVVGIEGHGKDGQRVTERASVVVGADGRYSLVAKTVRAEEHHQKPPLEGAYYTYYSGLPMNGRFEVYIRPNRGVAAVPTNDGLTLVLAGWPYAEFEANKKDVEGNFQRTIELHPAFAARVSAAKREARFAGAAVPNFFRKAWGPGWALVGDARYCKDPITAQGIRILSTTRRRAPARSIRYLGRAGPSTTRWPNTSVSARNRRCRCTSSPARPPRWNRHRPTCSSCSAVSTANKRRWTRSFA